MKILFNLAHQRSALMLLSMNDIAVGYSILSKICMDNGFPVAPAFFDKNLSFQHAAIYESIKSYVEQRLFQIPTPDVAVITDLGNLQFQLSLHYNEQ